MPLDRDFFANADDSLIRSEYGLAYSDQELTEIKSWIEDRDAELIALSSELATLLSLIAKALEPVSRKSSWRTGFHNAMVEHTGRVVSVKWRLDLIGEKFTLPNLRFMERHIIPFNLRASVNPEDFDASRNDEAVWDAHRKAALEALDAAKATVALKSAEKVASGEYMTAQVLNRLLEGYFSLIAAKTANAFRQRMAASDDFAGLAKAQILLLSQLFAVVSVADDKKYKKLLPDMTKSVDFSDADIASMARFHFDRAKEVILSMKQEFGTEVVDVKRALTRIADLRRELTPEPAAKSPAPAKKAARKKPSIDK